MPTQGFEQNVALDEAPPWTGGFALAYTLGTVGAVGVGDFNNNGTSNGTTKGTADGTTSNNGTGGTTGGTTGMNSNGTTQGTTGDTDGATTGDGGGESGGGCSALPGAPGTGGGFTALLLGLLIAQRRRRRPVRPVPPAT